MSIFNCKEAKTAKASARKDTGAVLALGIALSLFLPGRQAMAQSKLCLEAGMGYYELVHVGAYWNYAERSSVGLYAGTNFRYKERNNYSAGLAYHNVMLFSLWKIHPGFSIKAQYWSQDDENYFISNLSFIGNASLNLPIGDHWLISAQGGGVLNYTLQTDRKQNVTAGYPARANGNYCLNVRYKIGKK